MFDDIDYSTLSRVERVEALKNTLVARATGGAGDDWYYREVRRELLADAVLTERMPQFLRTCRNLDEFWPFIKEKAATYAERRAWLRDAFDPLLAHLEDHAQSPMVVTADLALRTMTEAAVNDVWRTMLERRTTDPEGAITAARTLVETVCKHILENDSEAIPVNAELPALYSAVAKRLKLAPDQHTELVFKQILGGCMTVVNGLAGVRNKLSDAHGKGPRQARPSPRHAELAVNLAGAMAAFLVSSWAARKADDF